MTKKYDQEPLITIGITSYNAQETIGRAIKSALNQKWTNLEIIVTDDCSTDCSIATIKKLISPFENIILIQHRVNLGPAAARQTILKHAKGEFIAFFDDDDESLPNRIRTQYERIISYEKETKTKLIACYASGKRIYPNGYTLFMEAIGSKPVIPYGKAVANRLLFYGQTPNFFFGAGTPTSSLMSRTSTFESVGGFDPNFRRAEDIDFAVRLALAGGYFIGCPQQLFIQYATIGNDKAPEVNLDAELQLAEKHKVYLESEGRYNYAKNWPYLRYYHFKKQYLKLIAMLLKIFVRYPTKTTIHFLHTVPKRMRHERKMNQQNTT